jgi:2-polyprenyl-3-methyl-5-hydroxy-6-metoxy-1,4-benzoquinol methylase
MIRTKGDQRLLENKESFITKRHTVKYGGLGSGEKEWDVKEDDRIFESSWTERYKYEAEIISGIIKENNYSKILELGSGPGRLANIIQEIYPPTLSYDLIDKPNAKLQNEKYNFKRNKFFTKDLNNGFDTTGLQDNYDLIIANDFLEHIANVTDCLVNCYNLAKENSKIFISVPNWRMGHSFQYRGLFDYDNWVYTMEVHGWKVNSVYPSNLKCGYSPKLSSESVMPDELIQSWNWYFVGNKK